MWGRRLLDDEILITRRQLGRSRSDMSYDVAGLGLGGEKKGKRKMYLYVGVPVVVIVIVIVGVWWAYFRMCPGSAPTGADPFDRRTRRGTVAANRVSFYLGFEIEPEILK